MVREANQTFYARILFRLGLPLLLFIDVGPMVSERWNLQQIDRRGGTIKAALEAWKRKRAEE